MINTKEYIGEIRKNNFGTPMKIIAARNKADIDVQFLDEYGYIWKHSMYRNFIKGEVKNPYDKMIFGIGYIGVGKYNTGTSKKHTREHYIWRAMLERCYAEHLKYRCPPLLWNRYSMRGMAQFSELCGMVSQKQI